MPALDTATLRELVAASPDAYVAVDAQLRVLDLNPAAERLVGRSRDEVVGRSAALLVPATQRGAVRAEVEHLVRAGAAGRSGRRMTGVVLAADGREVAVEATVTFTGPARDRVLVACVRTCDDDADRLLREHQRTEQLRRRVARARDAGRRLAALERAKSEFISMASHELRSPLTVLRGYLSMIEEGGCGPLPPQLQSVVPLLSAKVAQMNGLVDEMLESARLEDDRLELVRRPLDMRDLVTAAVASVEGLARPGQRLLINMPAAAVPVEADAARVNLILGNLLQNAFKYSDDGSEVRCTVSADGVTALVEVADEGVGIPAEGMDLLFTRFGRIVTEATRHIPGTGLGLYLSRRLARMHGGNITVSSTPAVGSTFRLLLPLSTAGTMPTRPVRRLRGSP